MSATTSVADINSMMIESRRMERELHRDSGLYPPLPDEDKEFRLALRAFISAGFRLSARWSNAIDSHRINLEAYNRIFKVDFAEFLHGLETIYDGEVALYYDVADAQERGES